MGCDIHLFAEKRVKGKWVTADTWEVYEDDDDTPKRKIVPYQKSFYHGRNYNLFAMLADVRNGRGFAGVKTGAGFNPICEPRGLPDDVTPEVGMEAASWAGDGHSHSWLTVQELLEYDWTQTTTLEGDLHALDFERWERYDRSRGEYPESYAGAIMGRDIKRMDEDRLRELIAKKKADLDARGVRGDAWEEEMQKEFGNIITHSCWEMPYHKCAKTFLSECLPKLWRLGPPADVRIVFFFDN